MTMIMIPEFNWLSVKDGDPRAYALYQPGIVLDPFFGSGTVGVVARQCKRDWLGIELNPDYIKLARKRIDETQPALFAR